MLVVLLTMVLQTYATELVLNTAYCPIIPFKVNKFVYNVEEPAPYELPFDPASGCFCRVKPNSYSVCYSSATCKSVPKEVIITTNSLTIHNTLIGSLELGDFDSFYHLLDLKIENNVNLIEISSGTFRNLSKLVNMSVSSNMNLKVLTEGSFAGLSNLKGLYLRKNGFENVLDVTIALSPNYLPNLTELQLYGNDFLELPEETFNNMIGCSLQLLNLELCRIEWLHPKVFNPLSNLKVLQLGQNSYNSSTISKVLKETILNEIPLKELDLSRAGFRKSLPLSLMATIAKSNITNLILSHNHFEVITNKTFLRMPKLELLDLTSVLALNISNDAFSNLPNLQTLYLSRNRLPSLPSSVLLQNLTYLDLQHNSGNLFTGSYFNIFSGKFSRMNKLCYLDLSFNKINSLNFTTFVGLDNLRVLRLQNATIYQIFNNSFLPLKKLVYLDLQNNYFVKNYMGGGLQKDVFNGLSSLEVLILSGSMMTYISSRNGDNPLAGLKSLRRLDLNFNYLTVLSPSDFKPLRNLELLDLSFNVLSAWQDRIFYQNRKLRLVDLSRNRIGSLSPALIKDFQFLKQLRLQDNPFSCDCSNWINFNFNSDLIRLLNSSDATCLFPDSYSNLTLLQFYKQVTCSSSSKLPIILPGIILTLIFLVTTLLAYYYRWHIRYWIFLTRLYLTRSGKIRPKPKQSYTNYQYDAFVSYSNEDRNFVLRLVTMLENFEPYLKLCVYERDFQIGTIISESVLESVAQSRRTLLIISDSYAKSQWCRWESQIAEHHRLFFDNEQGHSVDDTLVLIKLGPVSETHLTPTLRYLLKTRIYLQWEHSEDKQRAFWKKLRGALAPQKSDFNENTHL